jgi:hypothetical protein
MREFDFEKQRKEANAHIREMKVVAPYVFPAWQRLMQATDALREATKELERAQAAWEKLGKD